MDQSVKAIHVFFLSVVVLFLLKALAGILVPLVLALLCAVVLQPPVRWLTSRGVPGRLVHPLLATATLVALFVVSGATIQTFADALSQRDVALSSVQERLAELSARLGGLLGVGERAMAALVDSVVSVEAVTAFLGSAAGEVGAFSASFVMFALYFTILLPGMADHERYIAYVVGEERAGAMLRHYRTVERSVSTYVAVKVVISFVTGALAGLLLWLLGVEAFVFWGLVTFLLNFIPTVGAFIATAAPVLAALASPGGLLLALAILALLAPLQFVIGSVIEPRIMGDRLQLNTLTVVFGLVFWGYIWGVPGVLLSVLLLVIGKLVLEHSGSLEMVARAMSYPQAE